MSNTYSIANEWKYDVSDSIKKHILYKEFVAWNCNFCLIVPLTDYKNNPLHQELPSASEYFDTTDEMIYLNKRASKVYAGVLEKLNDNELVSRWIWKRDLQKIRLQVWGCVKGEYLYVLTEQSLTMEYEIYGIAKKSNIAS